jgi:hypothetical protein
MKNLTLLFLFVANLSGRSQTFTNAQVYDFAVGDVYQVTRQDVYNPPMSSCSTTTVKTDSILLKYYSAAMDTVFYTIHTDIYKPFICPSFSPPYFSSYTSTVFYTNLSDTATHFEGWPICMVPSDTIYNSTSTGCNDKWIYESNTDLPPCFEEPTWSSTFILGAGGPYVILQDPHYSNQMYTEYLNYYRKGTLSCGTYYHAPSPMDIFEPEKDRIQLYPNPTINVIHIRAVEENTYYTVTDITGRKIMDGEIKNAIIDVSQLQKGIYFISLSPRKGTWITKSFIRN